jgi:hypothetical protein
MRKVVNAGQPINLDSLQQLQQPRQQMLLS